MKFLTRTIIVLVVFNLAMGNLALAQAEGQAEPTFEAAVPLEPGQTTVRRQAPVWTCSMHPQIRLRKPGKCSICSMDLMPIATENSVGVPTLATAPPAVAMPSEQEPPMPSTGMPALSSYYTRARSTGQISSRKVLVIPTTEVKVEDLVE
ncbi:MAG: hypothetical protein IIC00_00465, partial [Planctomycetes bacterium]|nr:hypothetical protein [Planctomycetota bacterium]